MTVRVLALASGVTSLESHRLGLAPLSISAGVLESRAGLYPGVTAGDLGTVSAMVASVAPFSAWVDGTSASTQGGYSFTNDATVNITFDAGNASTIRTDRIIARVKDNPYDGSGGTVGSVEYLKGNTTTGAATALPAGSLLLWEVPVPVGASSGGGGINFASLKVDKRVYTATQGGIFPVASATDESAIVAATSAMTIFRTDLKRMRINDGSIFRTEPGIVIARGNRAATSSTTTTSEIGVLRLDSIPIETGGVYEICTGQLYLLSTVTNDTITAKMRVSTSGAATTSSTALGNGLQLKTDSVQPPSAPMNNIYVASTTGSLSVIITVQRTSGSGNVSIFGGLDLWVRTAGFADPGDTGVDL